MIDAATKSMIRDWLAQHDNDQEAVARWAARNLRGIAGIRQWRTWIAEAAAE